MTTIGYMQTKSTRVRHVSFSLESGNSMPGLETAREGGHDTTAFPSGADGFDRLD